MPEFFSARPSAVRIRHQGVSTWYHLWQGTKKWALRRVVDGRLVRSAFEPELEDFPWEPGDEVEQISPDEIESRTGIRARGISARGDGEATWVSILTQLAEGGAGEPPAPPVVAAAAGEPNPPGGNQRRVIPETELRKLYAFMHDFSSLACHLALAEEASRVPSRLAQRFHTSVMQFQPYTNVDEPFVPPNGREPLPDANALQQIGDTRDLTALLPENDVVQVTGARHLDFKFVEREVVPARTTGNAVYYDGRPTGHQPKLDWLLANVKDHRPIIAEVKVRGDRNPFFALVQALMYAAELATPNQRARLSRHYPGHFGVEGQRPLDVFVVLCNYNWASPARAELIDATSTLFSELIQCENLNQYVGRLACIEARWTPGTPLAFSSLFVASAEDDR